MDFSCDRCGRRYFVPDDLVHGRVFRAKCDDCGHAFDVVAPEAGAGVAVPAALARKVKIALSDDEVSKLVEAASPAAAREPEPARPAAREPEPARPAAREPEPARPAAREPEPRRRPTASADDCAVPLPGPTPAAREREPERPAARPVEPKRPARAQPEPAIPGPPVLSRAAPAAKRDVPLPDRTAPAAAASEAPLADLAADAAAGPVATIPTPTSPAAGSREAPLGGLAAGAAAAPEPTLPVPAAVDAPLPRFSFGDGGALEPSLPPLPKLSFTSDGALEPPLPTIDLSAPPSDEPPLPKLSFADLPDLTISPPVRPEAARAAASTLSTFPAPEPPGEPVELEGLLEPEAPEAPPETAAAPGPDRAPRPERAAEESRAALEAIAAREASAALEAAAAQEAAAQPPAAADEVPPTSDEASAPAEAPEASEAGPRRKGRRAAGAGREPEERRVSTDEFAIAAGTKHRHRSTVLALAGAVAVCAAAGVLVVRFARRGPDAASRPRAGTAAPSASGSVPFDASSLAARPRGAAPAPSGKTGGGTAGTKPRRRIVAGRIDDRKLLDLLGKKDDVPMAAPAEDVALDSAKDVLDPAAVERTVGASRKAFDACITKVLRLNPGFRVPGNRATILVTVQPTGKVTGAWIGEEQVEGTDLGRCLVAAASRMSFPTFEGDAIDVSIPLSLSAIQ